LVWAVKKPANSKKADMAILVKQEKRLWPRVDYHTEIRYQLRGKADFDNAVCSDISCGGLRFTGEKFIPTSTPVMFEINVLNRILRFIGSVAWSASIPHSDRRELGIKFIESEVPDQNYLKDFINMQLSAN